MNRSPFPFRDFVRAKNNLVEALVDGGETLRVRANQLVFINQIDLLATATTNVDNPALDALQGTGDFASLPWDDLRLAEAEPIQLPNPDGTYTTRRFFRGATWMERRSLMRI